MMSGSHPACSAISDALRPRGAPARSTRASRSQRLVVRSSVSIARRSLVGPPEAPEPVWRFRPGVSG